MDAFLKTCCLEREGLLFSDLKGIDKIRLWIFQKRLTYNNILVCYISGAFEENFLIRNGLRIILKSILKKPRLNI